MVILARFAVVAWTIMGSSVTEDIFKSIYCPSVEAHVDHDAEMHNVSPVLLNFVGPTISIVAYNIMGTHIVIVLRQTSSQMCVLVNYISCRNGRRHPLCRKVARAIVRGLRMIKGFMLASVCNEGSAAHRFHVFLLHLLR